MWIILAVIAITATYINLLLYKAGKDYKFAMAMGLSFTALTLCAKYSMVSGWVEVKDWAALADVVPSMAKLLWFLTIISILLNILPILFDRKGKR